MTREEWLARFVDRLLADTARQTMTSLILRDADCDLDDAAAGMDEYNREHRAELIRVVAAVIDEFERDAEARS
jgi:hypothetical protein